MGGLWSLVPRRDTPGPAVGFPEPDAAQHDAAGTNPDDVARAQDGYERRVDGLRLRGFYAISAVANVFMGLYDVAYVASGFEGRLEWLVGGRLMSALGFGAGWAMLRGPREPSLRTIEVLRAALPISLVAECAVLGLLSEGPESTFGAGAIVMPIGMLACVRPWRDNVMIALVTVLLYPLAMTGAGLVRPEIALQFAAPRVAFRVWSDAILSALVAWVVVVATHYYWQLRREHFASKAVGRYVLRRMLGRGGMGEVWSAWHPTLRREVAVKLLASVGGKGAIQRFEREVRATTELTHPNTVRIYDFGAADDGTLFYTMERLEGRTLAELVAAEGPLPPARAVHLLRQAASALTEAHIRGIVHRDVKPENLFVAVAGGLPDFVKVLDFGIAKGEGLTDVTGAARIVGSLSTISPEAARGEPTTAASDVYSLGATLYFALAGAFPFEGHTSGLLFAHAQTPAPSLEARCPGLPAALVEVVHRCLEKAPAARFASALELARALDALAETLPWEPDRTHALSSAAGDGRDARASDANEETLLAPPDEAP